MVAAGIPAHRCLEFLQHEDDPRLRAAVGDVLGKVESGWMFSRALATREDVFPGVAIHLIAAGEASGSLPIVLGRLADYLEKSSQLKKKVIAAFIYPGMLLGLTLVISALLVTVVFPKEKEMLDSMGVELPAATKAMMAILSVVLNPLAILLTGLAIALALAGSRSLKHPFLRRGVHGLALRLPVVGSILNKAACSRMLYTMSALISTGAAVGPNLAVVGRVAENDVLEERFLAATQLVTQGVEMDDAFQRYRVFPPVGIQMLRVGLEQGRLERVSADLARIMEEEVDSSLAGLAALMEPMALLFMGGLVGFIVMATALPTATLLQKL